MDRLYDQPALYDALRAPWPAYVSLVRGVLAREKPDARSFVDPACGPGAWLTAVAPDGARLAGNDLCERMVTAARDKLRARQAEVVLGDMRELAFETGPFDVALEASGSVCMLLETRDMERLLVSLERAVAPGGLALLSVFFRDRDLDRPRPQLLWRSAPVAVGGGHATIRYESIGWDPTRAVETIRRTVETRTVPGAPERIVDEYRFRIWTRAELSGCLSAAPALEWTRSVPMDDDPVAGPTDEPAGQQLVVLRRRG